MEFAKCEPGSEPDLIQFAQRLLEVSDQPVDCVAEPTGFSTAVNLVYAIYVARSCVVGRVSDPGGWPYLGPLARRLAAWG